MYVRADFAYLRGSTGTGIRHRAFRATWDSSGKHLHREEKPFVNGHHHPYCTYNYCFEKKSNNILLLLHGSRPVPPPWYGVNIAGVNMLPPENMGVVAESMLKGEVGYW